MPEFLLKTMEDYNLTDREFQMFRELVYKTTGISLSEAKRHMLKSRLTRRLRAHRMEAFEDYYRLLMSLDQKETEWTEFINSVTTNKTDFFREPHHFEFIRNKFLPEQFAHSKAGNPSARKLRIWHAGCSTGEEPYTLAMTLRESTEALGGWASWDIRQLASDIDTGVLAHAERGIYEEDRVAPVSPNLLRKYFLRGKGDKGGLFKVRPELQEQITFRQINLLAPEIPIANGAKFDIIFCRNVVIYFDKPTQRTLFTRFQEKLKPGGYLIIGHSESLNGVSEAYDSVGGTIYRLPRLADSRSAVERLAA